MPVSGTMRHKCLVEFTPDCVSKFERINRSRLTSETVSCLFIIGDCSIEFRTKQEINSNFRNILFNNSTWKQAIPVLIIKQASIFDRSQINLLEPVPFVY